MKIFKVYFNIVGEPESKMLLKACESQRLAHEAIDDDIWRRRKNNSTFKVEYQTVIEDIDQDLTQAEIDIMFKQQGKL